MKIQKILLTLLSLLSLIIAQDTWVKTYQPFGDGDYYVEDVLVCADSGYAVNGYYYCWDPEPGTGCDDYWGFLMKTDKDGNLEWVKMDTVSWIYESESSAFVQTDDGGFLSAVFSLWGGTALIKRDSLGNREWVVDNGGVYDGLYVHSMDKTLDGNIILAGRMTGKPTLRKVTQTGLTQWTQTYSDTSATLRSVVSLSDGGFASTGNIHYSTTGSDILVIKTDENGDSLWTWTYDGNNDFDVGRCIIETSDNNLLLAGSFGSLGNQVIKIHLEGDSLWMTSAHQSVGSLIERYNDSYYIYGNKLSKLNYSGVIEWSEDFEGIGTGGDHGFDTITNGFILGSKIEIYWQDYIGLIKTDTLGQVLSTVVDLSVVPQEFNLSSYPNPFNNSTTIILTLTKSTHTEISIYNIAGRKIKTLINGIIAKGQYKLCWDGTDSNNNQVSSGIYFINLIVNDQTLKTRKVTLIK